MSHPTEQDVQIPSVEAISQIRLLKRKSLLVSAPTGQRSTTLPLKGSSKTWPGGAPTVV